MAFLEVNNMCVNYGAVKAVKGVSLSIEKGEIVALIGSNGAGKSTIINSIAGLTPLASGSIVYDGVDITKMSYFDIVKNGISMSSEERNIFPRMSVLENLKIGAYSKSKKGIDSLLEKCFELFPILFERKFQMGGTLSGGEQQMLSIARALMNKPQLLMLDEPSLGLAPLIIEDIFSHIKLICSSGTTVFLVEQNARMALNIADKGYVIETGKIVLADTGINLYKNDKVKAAYLGGI